MFRHVFLKRNSDIGLQSAKDVHGTFFSCRLLLALAVLDELPEAALDQVPFPEITCV